MCRVVAHLLGELVVGQSLIWESDPRLARDAIRREPPDLLVTDIGMPDGGGAPLVRAVREGERASGRRAAILVITGDLTWSARREMLEAGADDLLSKPFTPADLVLAARRLLELHSGDPFG
jgi:DNA-binding response OmpR family regulator